MTLFYYIERCLLHSEINLPFQEVEVHSYSSSSSLINSPTISQNISIEILLFNHFIFLLEPNQYHFWKLERLIFPIIV